MSWSLIAEPGRRPDAVTVCATIAAGVRIRLEDEVEVGGVPWVIRWDNDLSFAAGMVVQLGTRLGFECHAVPPYSGHMKGKVERLGRRVQEEFCVLQPGFTHGAKTYSGKDPFRDTEALPAAELRRRLGLWIAEYNRSVHSTLGRTPLRAWAADATPLRRATNEQLRSALLVAPRTVAVHRRKGVHFAGQWWQGAGMLDIVGRKVEIHYPVGQPDFIEVFHEGRWRCTGWPARHLSEAQKRAIWARRDAIYEEVRAVHARGDPEHRLRAEVEAEAGHLTTSYLTSPQ